MFGIFRKKTKIEILNLKYKSVMKEAYKLSNSNRKKSDEKYFQDEEILKEIEILKEKEN